MTLSNPCVIIWYILARRGFQWSIEAKFDFYTGISRGRNGGLEYNLSDASSATLEVSNYDSKEVYCVKTVSGTAVAYRRETISADELPEDQLYDYKNPNK